ncbi:hypothetical protein CEE44_00540 [Candidatus Woesearchaeota archaeon B3_Woes]|nr:MAG: hypothetical protein CEE44_00540 [Candidatus Woesearchaeota archaeon B3_Woes]
MKKQNTLMNLIGQIRFYSLVDLMILLIAIGTNKLQFIGVIFLHLGFILYLEYIHSHSYRMSFPKFLWSILLIIGLIFYNHIAVIGFLICSFLYTRKNLPTLGLYSPLFRGLQYYFLTAGIVGFLNPLSFLAGVLLTLRNFAGDLRDTVKDRKEGLKTIPIIFGLKKSIKHIHLIVLLITSLVWWYISGLSILWLAILYVIQIGTYNLTPR